MSGEMLYLKCKKCKSDIVIEKNWTPGGLNDYGGYILECVNCLHVFSVHIGRDIYESSVKMGARQLDKYDDERGDKGKVEAKYNITE
jgi:hypothetical protein